MINRVYTFLSNYFQKIITYKSVSVNYFQKKNHKIFGLCSTQSQNTQFMFYSKNAKLHIFK